MKKRPIVLLKNRHKTYCSRGFYKMVRDMRDELKPGGCIVMEGFIGEIHNKIYVFAYSNEYDHGDFSIIEKVVKIGYQDKNEEIHRLNEYIFKELNPYDFKECE